MMWDVQICDDMGVLAKALCRHALWNAGADLRGEWRDLRGRVEAHRMWPHASLRFVLNLPQIFHLKYRWNVYEKKIYRYIYEIYEMPMCFTLPLWDPDFFLSWTLRSLRTMISVGFAESPWDAAALSRMFFFFRQVRHVWMLECWTPRSWSSELWWENSCYCASCTWHKLHKFARKEWKDAFLNFKDSLFEVLPGGSCLVRCREPFVGGASIATCLENNIDPNKDSRLRDAWRWWYELNWYHDIIMWIIEWRKWMKMAVLCQTLQNFVYKNGYLDLRWIFA